MSEVLDRIVRTKEQAHVAANHAYQNAQAILANGKPVRIVCQEHESDRTILQNRYYWGPCLTEIAEQAVINGQRWTAEAWHELFKRQFLGYEITKTKVAGNKRTIVVRKLRSTKKLKVKAMGEYLDNVQAFGAAELGVQFSVRKWQEYQG